MEQNLKADEQTLFVGKTIVALSKGDVLKLQVSATEATTLTLPEGLNAEIIARKISKKQS